MDNNGYHHDSADQHKKNGTNGVAANGKLEKKKLDAEEEDNPWKVDIVNSNYTPWSQLNTAQKWKRVIGYFLKLVFVVVAMYFFICSLDFLSSAFKLLGGEAAGKVLRRNDLMSNPLAGLMMGVMVTVLVQSSSTSTSIVVSMVGADILDIQTAIPIIMGANVGTSVTNTIVALGQISRQGDFRRAFAGATVHDMFNWLCVIVFLPLEIASGFMYHLTKKCVESLNIETKSETKKDILKKVTKPFTLKIVQVNKDAITMMSKNLPAELEYDHVILKMCCDKTAPLKCCRSAKSANKESFNTASINTTFRSEFCTEINSCVPSLTQVPNNCKTYPWNFRDDHVEYQDTLNCNLFSNDNSAVNCCEDAFSNENFLETVSQTQRENFCRSSSLSQCFSNTAAQTFSYAACIEDNSWFKSNVSVAAKDDFDCVDWVKFSANTTCNSKCDHLFSNLYPALNDIEVGAILLVVALTILCCCLIAVVKLLSSLLQGPMAMVIKKFINSDLPGPLAYFTGYVAILIGAGITIVVQSSSVFTSSLTPLVGIGVVEIERMYPLTLGSNIGTTTTAILSALANSGIKLQNSLQAAFTHLFFNIFGIMIFYPFPFFRPAITMAKFLGTRTAKYRWYAIMYIIVVFFLIPLCIFGLSMAGWYVLAAVLIPLFTLLLIVMIVTVIQNKRPEMLPHKLRNWKFLPLFLRSLEPYDSVMKKIFFCTRFQDEEEAEFDDVGKPAKVEDNSHVHDNTRV